MVEYEFKIIGLYKATIPRNDVDYEDVVYSIVATLTGTDGVNLATTQINKPVPFDPTVGEFLAYEQLSEQTCMGWLMGALSPEEIEGSKAVVASQIENPPPPMSTPPWENEV